MTDAILAARQAADHFRVVASTLRPADRLEAARALILELKSGILTGAFGDPAGPDPERRRLEEELRTARMDLENLARYNPLSRERFTAAVRVAMLETCLAQRDEVLAYDPTAPKG